MNMLIEYVRAHVERGACRCGKCFDAPADPETEQSQGHTANMEFFEVSTRGEPDAETLRALIVESRQGAFCDVDLFDGNEHNYMELGGWIGDQGLALMLMGLGSLLGLWNLLTPTAIFGKHVDKEQAMKLAGLGMVAIQSERPEDLQGGSQLRTNSL